MEQKIIYELLKRPIAYHPMIAKALGSVQLAVFWSQMYYWKDRGNDPDGWIYKTSDEIFQETGLKRRGQDTARKLGRKLGIIEELKKGMPAKLHYRIDMDETIKVLANHCKDIYIPKEPKREPKKKKPVKTQYGKFKKVLLHQKEYDSLSEMFTEKGRDKWIKTLDEGIVLKGYTYKSHYMAIIKWSERDKKRVTYTSNDNDMVRKARKDIQDREDSDARKESAKSNDKLRDMLRAREDLKRKQRNEN